MEITLTTRYIKRVTEKKTLEIKEGLEVEYYNVSNIWIDRPSYGVIKKDNNGFYIEWEDTDTLTRLDGSNRSKDVLENTGFKF